MTSDALILISPPFPSPNVAALMPAPSFKLNEPVSNRMVPPLPLSEATTSPLGSIIFLPSSVSNLIPPGSIMSSSSILPPENSVFPETLMIILPPCLYYDWHWLRLPHLLLLVRPLAH